mgnify:CR=1 FL=1
MKSRERTRILLSLLKGPWPLERIAVVYMLFLQLLCLFGWDQTIRDRLSEQDQRLAQYLGEVLADDAR